MSERAGAAPSQQQQWLSVPQVLALVEQHRQAGRLAAAEDLCRQVLRSQPRNAEVLHLLGIVLHQGGNAAAGIESIKQAIAANGNVALYHCNLGEMCRLAGRLEEAVAAGRRALELQPNYSQALNNLGIAHYDREDYEAAVECYRQAVRQDPSFAEAHSNLGNALRAQHKLEEAIASYNRGLQLKPAYADALNNLGTALRDAKRWSEAEIAYRKALALKPQDPATLNNLALVVMDLQRNDEAAAILTRSVALDPSKQRTYVYLGTALRDCDRLDEARAAAETALKLDENDGDALNLLGRILIDQNRLEEAIEFFHKTIARKPDDADAYNNLGNALKELGRADEAMQSYYKALELMPKATSVYLNLSDTKTFKSAEDPELRVMEEMAHEMGSLSEDEQMQLHFALSKAYMDLKRHADAFPHMLAGNAIKRTKIAYDERPTLQLFDRIREVMTPELIRANLGLGNPTSVPIFILGMPRSGSTLIEQILASHPKVHAAGEIRDLDSVVKSVRGPDGAIVPYPEFVPTFKAEHYRSMGTQYLRRLRNYSQTAQCITNKMPSSFFYTGLIHLALPNARILHTARNPVDTCLSCFSKLFAGLQAYSYDLGELGRYYRKYHELMAHWRNVLPTDAMLDVQYEDVVSDFETQARRIVAYCGLEWDDACLAFHETKRPVKTASAMQVRRPIYKSSVGRWEPYRDVLKPLLQELPLDWAV
jgi:tetratricopeptide (TPR) repeat protein